MSAKADAAVSFFDRASKDRNAHPDTKAAIGAFLQAFARAQTRGWEVRYDGAFQWFMAWEQQGRPGGVGAFVSHLNKVIRWSMANRVPRSYRAVLAIEDGNPVMASGPRTGGRFAKRTFEPLEKAEILRYTRAWNIEARRRGENFRYRAQKVTRLAAAKYQGLYIVQRYEIEFQHGGKDVVSLDAMDWCSDRAAFDSYEDEFHGLLDESERFVA